jgi:hypothetical protein
MTASRAPVVLICFALFILWGFGYETVGLRLGIALDGVVISRQELPRNWYTHGTGTAYVVRADDGTDQSYVAGATDGSLPRSLPLGAHVTKRKWELSYLLNGKRVEDFPVMFYAVVLAGALVCLVWSALQVARRHWG